MERQAGGRTPPCWRSRPRCWSPAPRKLVPLGKVPLRGLAEPLPLYRLLGVANRSSWLVRSGSRALTTLVGRQQELALLHQALRRAEGRDGEPGEARAVALVADAGMGKSRLVHDFLGASPLAVWRVMRVETTVHSLAVPYLLVTALLRSSSAARAGRSPGGDRRPAGRADVGVGDRLHAAAALPGQRCRWARPRPDRSDPAPAGICWPRWSASCGARRHRQPLILVIEDYHWLDASSVEAGRGLLDGLAAAARPAAA
ncbi:ATP-binding protein [Dankookia sp. P2]|uniref:ATP-binding protein n=1 Tax=Dankookia sp. P2 TaxID=3423955 RepID=UPI003D6671AD